MNTVSDIQALFLLLALVAVLVVMFRALRPNRSHPMVGPGLAEFPVPHVSSTPVEAPRSYRLPAGSIACVRVLTTLTKERTANSAYNQLRRDGCFAPFGKRNVEVVLNQLASQGFIRRTRRTTGVSTYAAA